MGSHLCLLFVCSNTKQSNVLDTQQLLSSYGRVTDCFTQLALRLKFLVFAVQDTFSEIVRVLSREKMIN